LNRSPVFIIQRQHPVFTDTDARNSDHPNAAYSVKAQAAQTNDKSFYFHVAMVPAA
jgi:hypothetical protein